MANAVLRAVSGMLKIDPGLAPYEKEIALRENRLQELKKRILGRNSSLSSFADGYFYFGFHRNGNGWVFREWLPGADEVSLFGDFNGWNRGSHPLYRLPDGVWEIALNGRDALRHGQHVKLLVRKGSQWLERIPAYIRYCEMDESSHKLCGMIWESDSPYIWGDRNFFKRKKPSSPLIYEAHIGMAQEKEGIGTYREFAQNVLPRIHHLGYNTLQLMAVMEHPYYASFGYQVTSLFAPAHWFGSPEDLKELIDRAHGLGITVLLDVVHSHACLNEGEGLYKQDGTEEQYFLPGERGRHEAWGTGIYDYGKTEVMHLLLSNLKYWVEEFHFDGFRFDGVTSMIFENHGLGTAFTDYGQYYGLNTNIDALNYLTLANTLVHELNPYAITVAEDMSGTPGMALPEKKAGIGFDYRLAMGLPDFWIKTLKEREYGHFPMGALWKELTDHRPQEKVIAYCESHDQALVGDMTLLFRMVRAEIYTGMEKSYHSPSMDAAVDFHKLIRLVTLLCAGDGYLNFMGNEFGHPEWIDFPREGNGWSHKYARRQWSLAENGLLKYAWLEAFDREMLALAKKQRILKKDRPQSLWIDEEKQMLSFARGDMLFVFNFHHEISQSAFFVHTHLSGDGDYRVIFSTDEEIFGGQGRVQTDYVYSSEKRAGKGQGFSIYVPCRCAIVLKRIAKLKK